MSQWTQHREHIKLRIKRRNIRMLDHITFEGLARMLRETITVTQNDSCHDMNKSRFSSLHANRRDRTVHWVHFHDGFFLPTSQCITNLSRRRVTELRVDWLSDFTAPKIEYREETERMAFMTILNNYFIALVITRPRSIFVWLNVPKGSFGRLLPWTYVEWGCVTESVRHAICSRDSDSCNMFWPNEPDE
jgi:hypothetical protein